MNEQLNALARGYAEAGEQAKEHGPAVAYGWLAARVESILAGAGYETPWSAREARITMVEPDGSEKTTLHGGAVAGGAEKRPE